MATLTIKNLPDEIYAALSQTAKRNRRSINSEAIVQLTQSNGAPRIDAKETIERLRRHRAKYPNLRLTEEDIYLAKNEGRP